MALEQEIKQKKFGTLQQKATVNIMFTNGWVEANQTKILKPYGLSIQQYNILRILRGQYPNPARITLLIERMMDKMSNASRLVDKLFEKGLASRSHCSNDRRAVDVSITTKGITVLEKLDILQLDWEQKTFSHLSTEELNDLNNLLDKVRNSKE